MAIPFVAVYVRVNSKEEHYGIVMVDYKDNTINYHNCDIDGSEFTIPFDQFKENDAAPLGEFLQKHKMIGQDRGVSLGYLEQHINNGSAMCENMRNYRYIKYKPADSQIEQF